jgi:signal transduction histidine kinase
MTIDKSEEELIKANRKLAFQDQEREKRAAELVIANKELAFQNKEKEKRADELIIANKELLFQNTEKEKRAAELVIANEELAFRNREKELREDELVVANIELDYQNDEKEKRAEELIISNKEQDIKNEENEKRTKELSIANLEQGLDISELKQAELEIKLKNEQLEKLNAEKDKFFSIIAHDLRGPFSGFLGFTDLLKTDIYSMSKDELQDTANRMFSSASSLFRLLTNLLEWSIAQRGLTAFEPEVLSLKDLADDSLKLFYDVAKNKGIVLKEKIPEDIFVVADKLMLNTILRNFVSNSIKFTETGGRILITTRISEDKVEISIADTGIGMNQEMLNDLFRIDVKSGRKGTNDEPSTGLGLILCKEFVEKHNGKISVLSEVGKGSLFTFSLPLAKTDENV